MPWLNWPASQVSLTVSSGKNMIRMILGSTIAIFGFLGFAVEVGDYQDQGSWNLYGLLLASIFVVVGMVLFYCGKATRVKENRVIEVALSMYRQHKHIDALQISSGLRMLEIGVRKAIRKAQKRGVFPEDVEIM